MKLKQSIFREATVLLGTTPLEPDYCSPLCLLISSLVLVFGFIIGQGVTPQIGS